MKKPVPKPSTSAPTPEPEPAAVVEPPHDQIKAKRMTEAEYTSRMKFTIIGSPTPRGRVKAS